MRLGDTPGMCRLVLTAPALAARSVPDQPLSKGCGYENASRVTRLFGAGAFLATCPLAAALALWLRHEVQPAARALLGSEVARLGHVGSYACRNVNNRNVNNRDGGRRSEHATANAFDITAFRLADGRRITVEGDWGGGGPTAAFLARIHDAACGLFGVVLGPDANAAHRTHFHLDRAAFSACR